MAIPGILCPNRVIGKVKDKDLCLFIPDDKTEPFYIPYKNKLTRNFCKIYKDRFITAFPGEKPYVDQNIGEVTDFNAFCEYKVHCKKLNKKQFKVNIVPCLTNPESNRIITIDSSTTRDFDDAIGINNDILTVYIADVPSLLEQYQLWNNVNKVSSIYLPDNVKRPMLPTKLSEDLLSLTENTIKQTFCMNINIKTFEITFEQKVISVEKNCVYESEELLNHPVYQQCFNAVQTLILHFPYKQSVNNSYELVEYLMLFMNAQCALTLKTHNVGVYRSVKIQNKIDGNTELSKFLSYWRNATSSYTLVPEEHELLQIPDYVHITSPIRRLVDILNMYEMQKIIGIEFTEMAHNFVNSWYSNINTINETVSDIRHIQNECAILYYYWDREGEEDVDAYVIENKHPNYTIYIPSSKYVCDIYNENELVLHNKIKVKVYFFNDKATLKKKIRVASTNNCLTL